MKTLAKFLIVGLVCGGLCGCGFTAPSRGEGVADLGSLDLSADVSQTIAFSLGPLALNMAAWFVDDEAQKMLLRELGGVRVKHFEIDVNGDTEAVADKLRALSVELQSQNWEPIVRVKEDGEQADILARVSDETIRGFVLLVMEEDEAIVVNVMGDLDPEFLGELLTEFDLDLSGMTSNAT